MTQCNFTWLSPAYGRVRCTNEIGHYFRHEYEAAFLTVGGEHLLNGRWMNLNLEDGKKIDQEISELESLQKRLKSAFAEDELEGGWKAALTHPLYIEAQRSIDRLKDELKLLI